MTDLKNITRRIILLGSRISESGDIAFGSQTTETPELTETVEVLTFCDCGHKSSNIFRDRFTGAVVCQDNCVVTCSKCNTKVWVEVATKVGEDYFCPDHDTDARWEKVKRLLFSGLTKRKEE